MLNIALFGAPGAGKGTQSKLLIEKYNLTYISTGDILREEIKAETELGREIKNIIDKGGLVSDEEIVKIIEKKMTMNQDSQGFLFDGFPRTIVQAYILEGLLLKQNMTLTCMLSLDVPRKELVRRLLHRSKTSGRADDNLEVINVRLKEYESKTRPVIDFYKERGKYFQVDGVGEIEDIFVKLTHIIEQSLSKEYFNVVLLGKPGSGKGTQGDLLAKEHKLHYISTGKILRREIRESTEIGRLARPYMEKGEIVPDEIAIKLIEQRIESNPTADGYIFKGFPRTIVQAYIMDGLLRKLDTRVSCMINLRVPTLEAIKRLNERNKTEKRRPYDSSTEMILKRMEQYNQKTLPVLEYYKKQGKYFEVDGIGTSEEVFERLSNTLLEAFKFMR